MKSLKLQPYKYGAFLPCAILSLAIPVAAQINGISVPNTASNIPIVVISATRSAQALSEALADVSVISRSSIERSGAGSVAQLLQQSHGMNMSQNGGPATPTSVYIRGADSRFTAVFIDGVRIDSQSTAGASWQSIPLAQIDHIEVLRGPAAAVYGSDAVAGVVHIFTRQGDEGFFPSVQMGIGDYGTREIAANLRGGTADFDYALGLAGNRSTGQNAVINGSNPDRDGYRSHSFSGRIGWKIQPGQKVELNLLDNDQKSGFDADGSKPPTIDQADQKLKTAGAQWSASWSDAWSTRLAYTQSLDSYADTTAYTTQTEVRTYLARNELRWGAGVINADLERREDALQNKGTQPSSHTQRHQNAVALGYGWQNGIHAFQVNGRHDDDSEFGGQSTGSLAYGYSFAPEWRATTALATAFRAPTLYQRFSDYGWAELKPEHSRNAEVALRWQDGAHKAALTAYRNAITNLIDYVSGPGPCRNGVGTWPGCYGNVGRTRLTGTTFSGATQWDELRLEGFIDWMLPKNEETEKLLARRPRLQSRLNGTLPFMGWHMGAEWQWVGERFDDAKNTQRLQPYSLVNLSGTKQLSHDWGLLLRVNNLTDKDYSLAKGYATPGRTWFMGVSWAPQR